MLSAFKNFFVTFLISALVFGAAAYFATQFLTETITGIFDAESSELDHILNPGTDTTAPPPVTDSPVTGENPPPEKIIEGNSFNMLFIVTDYQPEMFSDYLPDANALDAMEKNPEISTGVLGANYRRFRACSVLLLRADKEKKEFILTPFPALTRVYTASGYQTMDNLANLYGTDFIVSEVSSMTGLHIDHYLLVNVTELSSIVNQLGGVSLYFSKDLYYNGITATTEKPAEDSGVYLPLLYKIGKNAVDGTGSIALMMNEDYSSASGVAERNTMMVNFFTALMNKLIDRTQAELTAFYDGICENALVTTTFTPKDMVSQIGLIYAFGSQDFKVTTLEYPGRYVAATETDAAYFEPNTASGLKLFKAYRPYEKTNTGK